MLRLSKPFASTKKTVLIVSTKRAESPALTLPKTSLKVVSVDTSFCGTSLSEI